jgi:hypothetical protein
MNLTPLHLEIMLHAYAHADPVPRSHAPAVQRFVHDLEDEGLLDTQFPLGALHVRATEKGKAFVAMLLNTPMPEQAWVDSRNNELINYE